MSQHANPTLSADSAESLATRKATLGVRLMSHQTPGRRLTAVSAQNNRQTKPWTLTLTQNKIHLLPGMTEAALRRGSLRCSLLYSAPPVTGRPPPRGACPASGLQSTDVGSTSSATTSTGSPPALKRERAPAQRWTPE